MTRPRLRFLLLLLLGVSLWATPSALGVPRSDVASPGWTSTAQADLELPEQPSPHHAPVLRRARRASGAGLLESAHVRPVAAPLDPRRIVRLQATPPVSQAWVAPEPLRPYVTTLPPPARS